MDQRVSLAAHNVDKSILEKKISASSITESPGFSDCIRPEC